MNELTKQIRNIDIVSVLNAESVELKRAGNKYIGLCPFHSEKNPSFTVFPDNRAKCFGCGWSGDPLDFIMSLRNLAFNEALSYLGISQEPLSIKDHRNIEKQKHKTKQRKQRVKRERDLACTIAFLIRSAYKALNCITPDNLNEFGETLIQFPGGNIAMKHCAQDLRTKSGDAAMNLETCQQLKGILLLSQVLILGNGCRRTPICCGV